MKGDRFYQDHASIFLQQAAKTFATREAWLDDDLAGPRTSTHSNSGSFDEADAAALQPQPRQARRVAHRCVLRPSSFARVTWDLVGLCLICWDMMYIPVQLAFDLDQVPFTEFMFWVTLLFWTADIPLSFFTGYFDKGQEEIR